MAMVEGIAYNDTKANAECREKRVYPYHGPWSKTLGATVVNKYLKDNNNGQYQSMNGKKDVGQLHLVVTGGI